jgi:hypothetical protein
LNECGACGADFTSVVLFDAHRVGKHERDYPEHEDGRRCLTSWEMTDRGWVQNVKGSWLDPTRVEKARESFRRAA